MRTDEALTRFANSEIHQNVAEANTVVNLRFVDGQRVGVASHEPAWTTRRCAGWPPSGRDIARLQPERDEVRGLPEPGADAHGRGRLVSAATAGATPEARAAACARPSSPPPTPPGVLAYGSYTTAARRSASPTRWACAPSEARSLGHLITVDDGPRRRAGYAESAAVDHTGIDAAAIGREAAEQGGRQSRGRGGA